MQIGIITKPQALKGQFRVKPDKILFDDFKDLKSVIIKGKAYNVQKVILRDSFVILKVEGIERIEEVEPLRNTPILIEDVDNGQLEDDEYYVDDLIGAKVVDDKGVIIGTLSQVNAYGGASVFTVVADDKEILFPHARNVIKSFDADNKILVVDRKIFEEISLWR